jgi:predicted RNA binding protein YcfA (HicA-like mRNA interferase family)
VLQRGSLTCVVPHRKELRLGTLSGILDQAELTVDELLAALK